MRYVFRRGMVILYLGLITAYGAIAFTGNLVLDGTVSRVFYGVLFTSTILHYYYDGFIWKMRETTNQVGLGIKQNSTPSRINQLRGGEYAHLLKWSPLIVGLGYLFAIDLLGPTLTTTQKYELDRRYSQALIGKSVLPSSEEERSWLISQFERTQAIATSVPDDRNAQLRAAIMLTNFGRHHEAIALMEKVLQRHPAFCDGQLLLGEINLHRGNLDQSELWLQSALSHATTERERSAANLKLGEVSLYRHDQASAEARFEEALRDNPKLEAEIGALRKSVTPASVP